MSSSCIFVHTLYRTTELACAAAADAPVVVCCGRWIASVSPCSAANASVCWAWMVPARPARSTCSPVARASALATRFSAVWSEALVSYWNNNNCLFILFLMFFTTLKCKLRRRLGFIGLRNFLSIFHFLNCSVIKDRNAVRKHIGFCPQFDALNLLLTAREQVNLTFSIDTWFFM